MNRRRDDLYRERRRCPEQGPQSVDERQKNSKQDKRRLTTYLIRPNQISGLYGWDSIGRKKMDDVKIASNPLYKKYYI